MLQVFKKIKNYILYILLCVKQNLISSFANKKSFFLQSILMALNNITWLIVWLVIFNKAGDNINGVTLNDILYLWSLPVISFGITFVCFGGIEDLSSNISKGNLDVYLSQPKFSLIGLLTSKCKISAIGDLMYGLIIGLFATKFNILNYLFLLLLSIFASIVLTSIISIIHMLSFWLGNISNLATIYTNSLLITLTIYPQKMFNSFTKILIFTFVPVFYCTHLPVSLCASFSFQKLFGFALAVIIFSLLALFIYNKGLKRYESGNGFNLR